MFFLGITEVSGTVVPMLNFSVCACAHGCALKKMQSVICVSVEYMCVLQACVSLGMFEKAKNFGCPCLSLPYSLVICFLTEPEDGLVASKSQGSSCLYPSRELKLQVFSHIAMDAGI